eukprot:UN00456
MSNQIKQVATKTVTQAIKPKYGFYKHFTRDIGNFPLIVANVAAIGLIGIFVSRKVFYHPDVIINRDRAPDGEAPRREDYSYEYRKQTRFFAEQLAPLSRPIVDSMLGINAYNPRVEVDDKLWSLSDTRDKEFDIVPLEHTNFFKGDSLYRDVPYNKNDPSIPTAAAL